jgi:hypothetical protein
MPFVSVRDIHMYYELRGNGPRLLFISGTGGDLPGEWPGFIQAASANSDSARGTASIGGDRCPRLTHCWVSQVLQS